MKRLRFVGAGTVALGMALGFAACVADPAPPDAAIVTLEDAPAYDAQSNVCDPIKGGCSPGIACCDGHCCHLAATSCGERGCYCYIENGIGVTCAGGQRCCDGACIDPMTDGNHCGKCGNACEAPACNGLGICDAVGICDDGTCSENVIFCSEDEIGRVCPHI